MRKLTVIPVLALLAACSTQGSVETTTTTAPEPETITIVAVGDIACSGSQRASGDYDCADIQVAETARQQNPDFVFALGDIQYNSHQVENFQKNFAMYWADMLSITKPVPGNHEYAMGGAKGYYSVWTDYPAPGYYSFDLNEDWRVVAINTNDNCSDVECHENSEQYRWAESVLSDSTGKCVIAIGHHPRYSSGNHGSNKSVSDIYDLFAKNNVQVYLAGHDHHYERIDAPVPQFVVGTGGKSLRSLEQPVSGPNVSQVFATADHHGVLVVEISGLTMTAKFVNIDGQVLDTYTQNCIY